jgi:hypothetical protein
MQRARASVVSVAFALSVAVVGGGACLPGTGPALDTGIDAEAPPPTSLVEDGGIRPVDVDLGDPFAIIGLVPSHGPWTGGTRAKLSGRGFSSKLRVWIGGTELDASAIFASDPTRAAVETPPGKPGPADVKIKDERTAQERVLVGGYLYDAFVVNPDSGATSGGTRITLLGSGTAWKAGTTVTVGGVACGAVTVTDATHLECVTPPGSPGAKDVAVTTDGALAQARDAFTYGDSPDGFRGGLSGGALNGSLRVLAFDAWAGVPIPAAFAIAGASPGIVKTTDGTGVAQITDPTLKGKVTVTVAATCHQPTSFVDVTVDTVTAYLTPTLDLACAKGDPPSVGGHGGRDGAQLEGELIWPGVEFKPGDWSVPPPVRANERRAAYVFVASGSPTDGFYLPPKEQAILPETSGTRGYPYVAVTAPGNVTLYALAGIEDRTATPPKFTAYTMGVARGVPAQGSARTTGIDIPMTTMLDHALTLTADPPPPGARGPDRFVAKMATTIGQNAYAILPVGSQTAFLPLSSDVGFVGVPALDGALAGERYVLGASAVTGPGLGFPASYVAQIATTESNAPVVVGGFLPVPVMHAPATGSWNGTHVSLDASGTVDLEELVVSSGNGLVTWTILAPGGATSFDLPDLSALPGKVGLVRGEIRTTGYVARINGFSYAKLRYGQITTGAWNAYAVDAAIGSY